MKSKLFLILIFTGITYSQMFYSPSGFSNFNYPDPGLFAPNIKEIIDNINSSKFMNRETPELDTSVYGPVKSVIIKSLKDGVLAKKIFDKKRRLISYIDFSEVGSGDKYTYEYDVINRITKKKCYDRDNGELDEVFEYKYKADGTLYKVILYDNVDEFERSYNYTYSKGLLLVRDSEDLEKYYYNDQNNLVKRYENWDDGVLKNYIEYSYDDSNRIKTITEYYVESKQGKKTSFFYRNGRVLKKVISDDSRNNIWELVYEYDKDELDSKEYAYYVNKKIPIYTVVDRDEYNNVRKIKVNKGNKISYIVYYYEYFVTDDSVSSKQ